MSIATPLIGAWIQSEAAKDAAKTQAKGAERASEAQLEMMREAIREYRRQFNVSQRNIEPFRKQGLKSLLALSQLNRPGGYLAEEFEYGLDDFEADPGYQFRLEEGAKALDRSAAARGRLFSGAHARDLTRYNQDYASSEYDKSRTRAFNEFQVNRSNRFNRLAALAGVGQTATTTLANLGARNAENIGGAYERGGQARASGYINAANARAAGRMGAANAWAYGLDESAVRAQEQSDAAADRGIKVMSMLGQMYGMGGA